MQILAEICQNRIAHKDEFFRKSYVTQIRKPITRKSCVHSPGLRTKNFRAFRFLCDLWQIKRWTEESVSCAEIQIYSINFPLETLLGSTIRKKQRYRGVATEVKNTQAQRKQKKKRENGKIKWVVSHKRFSLTPFSQAHNDFKRRSS